MHSRLRVAEGAGETPAVAANGAGLPRKALIDGDPKATDDFTLYDRGLAPIARSGWTLPDGEAQPYPALETSLDVDVVVIGAGLAGGSLALHLSEAGISVAVLESRQPGWGASGRNAGHVLPVLKDIRLLERFADGGAAFRESFREHHTIPFDLAERYGIDCDATRAGYLNGMTSRSQFESFRDECAYLERDGFQKVRLLGQAEMEAATGSSRFPYGVMFGNGGRVNPYLLTQGMIAAADQRGSAIHGESEALSLTRFGGRWRVRTAKGEVLANRVVFCTAAYPTHIVPEFETCFHPLTAYALTTRPLDPEAAALIMPGGATFAQAPIDLNPLVKDRHGRLILSSLPATSRPQDGAWHFRNQLDWIHAVWPDTRTMDIRLETYWTGRVAMRTREFPGVYSLGRGVFGLMHFNAWGNVMAPLMGMLLADGIAKDAPDKMPFPLERPEPVFYRDKQEVLLRRLLIPAARTAQRLGVI